MEKTALITGVTGQDGSYLAELLIEKGYTVFGLIRRASTYNTQRIDHLIRDHTPNRFDWERGDLSDSDSLLRVLQRVKPDEVYHLGAQSHVHVSFEIPIYTFDVIATGSLRLFEAIRTLGLDCRVYNAASSEMFGASPPPQVETTPFFPRSPYAVAKVAAFHHAVNFRDAYGMQIWNGILFNHESPGRGETFLTRKVTRAVARIAFGLEECVTLGNLDAERDWGYAKEYVEAMWMMLQSGQPDDYVIATGERHSVREFVEHAFASIGVTIAWEGSGLASRGVAGRIVPISGSRMRIRSGDVVVGVDARYFRASEVDALQGDASKAQKAFGWKPKVKFSELAELMMRADLQRTKLLLDGTTKSKEEWRSYIV
jgi:GDPmannose 4,6-dehydratase